MGGASKLESFLSLKDSNGIQQLVQRRTFYISSHMDKIYADKNKSKKNKTKSVTVPDPVSDGESKSSKKRDKSVSGNPVAKKRKK